MRVFWRSEWSFSSAMVWSQNTPKLAGEIIERHYELTLFSSVLEEEGKGHQTLFLTGSGKTCSYVRQGESGQGSVQIE